MRTPSRARLGRILGGPCGYEIRGFSAGPANAGLSSVYLMVSFSAFERPNARHPKCVSQEGRGDPYFFGVIGREPARPSRNAHTLEARDRGLQGQLLRLAAG